MLRPSVDRQTIANAYGYGPEVDAGVFAYQGTAVPHLDFSLNPSNPTARFSRTAPRSARSMSGGSTQVRMVFVDLHESPATTAPVAKSETTRTRNGLDLMLDDVDLIRDVVPSARGPPGGQLVQLA